MQRTYTIVDGAKSLRLINNYEMIFIDTRIQPVYTVVLDCPGKDSIRLWPLPVVDPWVEDWWERKDAEGEIADSDIDPWHALLEVNVQLLILRAWQGIPYRSKTLDAAAARHAP